MVNYGGKGPKPTTHVQKVALVIAHVCAVVSVILVSRWANGTGEGFLGGLDWGDKNLVFNYHPVLMVTAFVFSFTEALLVYRTFPFSKRVNKSIHLGLQTLAVILASVGLRVRGGDRRGREKRRDERRAWERETEEDRLLNN